MNAFEIEHVLEVANKHPFYSSNEYPFTPYEVAAVVANANIKGINHSNSLEQPFSLFVKNSKIASIEWQLSRFPVTQKDDIYNVILRLLDDKNPKNTFQQSTYISQSGGGGGVTSPIAFFTDLRENRGQRAAFGSLIRNLKIVDERDCILSLHTSGKMYRALDLVTEVLETAGSSVLPLGHLATPEEIMMICQHFNPTIISGDTSQLLHLASYIHSTNQQHSLHLKSLIYTSEPLTRAQHTYLSTVFSCPEKPLNITSFFASAEMGIWAAGNFELTGFQSDDTTDLIFDSRHMIVEVLPLNTDFSSQAKPFTCKLEYNKVGLLVVTCLQRLRHPLVRYFTGDVGSVHTLPDSAITKLDIETEHLRVLRLQGRDARRSFKWEGEYFEFSALKNVLSTPCFGILRWQIILTNDASDPTAEYLDVRMLKRSNGEVVGQAELYTQLKAFFYVHAMNERLFSVSEVGDNKDFVRSESGNKVIMLVDRRKSSQDKQAEALSKDT